MIENVAQMCSGKPWPALCVHMNLHPLPWVVATMAVVAYFCFKPRRPGW